MMGVDVGYGFVKAVSLTGQKVCFPSLAAPAGVDLDLGFGGPAPGYKVTVRRVNGQAESYLVGEAAQGSFLASGFLGAEKPAELHDLLLLTAAYLVGAGTTGFPPVQVDLAVGLPLAFYRAQKDVLKTRLEALAAWVSVDSGSERYISFRRVMVVPQGAGVVFAQGLPKGRGFAGVIDIGQYTTDFLLVDLRTGRPVVEASGSVEAGCHLVGQRVAQAYLAKTGRPLPPRMERRILDDLAEGGKVVFRGRELDLSTEYREAVDDTAEAVARQVLSAWRDFTDSVAVTYLAGGGALLLGERLARAFPNPVLVGDPVFANALGYLRMVAG
ncbi:ParM/StbA family protein [Desulfofundulus sp. TPOSR]|uniref:ParM/StbA family protein n=1 Tax=Desulfofundulus sp. TPOSR TaxID=2714340 RepID=UPI00140AC8F3|nr:ParM/StbA family protein [Desulfofundulus sp. TPOSR]NHM25977.1 ParM/StbA family protein [Desulfofundulus sp. TPOSR]